MSNFTKQSVEKKLAELEVYEEIEEHNEMYFKLQERIYSHFFNLKNKILRTIFF